MSNNDVAQPAVLMKHAASFYLLHRVNNKQDVWQFRGIRIGRATVCLTAWRGQTIFVCLMFDSVFPHNHGNTTKAWGDSLSHFI